nr:Dioxygenase TauD/TfdA [uncultured bacterium]
MKDIEAASSERKASWAARRASVKPRAFDLSSLSIVELGHIDPDKALPLVIRPSVGGINLAEWIKANYDFIRTSLWKHGGILFRGFGLGSKDDFDGALKSIPVELMYYMEGATPRTELGGRIYTSTEFPADQSIALHNELCYVTTWPMKIWFFCVTPAETGGQTPIGDVRKVLPHIPAEIRQRFIEKGWMLVRNFGDHMGLPWQRSFRVGSKAEAEDYFRRGRISFEWKGGDRLRTWQVRPAVATHPVTGEQVWFNHTAFWHVSSLEPNLREMLLADYGEEGLPFATYYGDGSPIPDDVIEALREAYRKETVAFLWEKGDLLMLDNMLAAHGRFPYSGPRVVLTAMGEPYSPSNG